MYIIQFTLSVRNLFSSKYTNLTYKRLIFKQLLVIGFFLQLAPFYLVKVL